MVCFFRTKIPVPHRSSRVNTHLARSITVDALTYQSGFEPSYRKVTYHQDKNRDVGEIQ
jgi:hypothetical protein